ncbi:MAG: hypothetical protein LBP56_04260 [Odoribacteraceae bacterium]|nr:hypothetical protein [Odoribacteraceae bacterium]
MSLEKRRSFTYNLQLKKGWNVVYWKETEKGDNVYEEETTTQKPAGVTIQWLYDPIVTPAAE